jgi:hypothetical protein
MAKNDYHWIGFVLGTIAVVLLMSKCADAAAGTDLFPYGEGAVITLCGEPTVLVVPENPAAPETGVVLITPDREYVNSQWISEFIAQLQVELGIVFRAKEVSAILGIKCA